MKVKAILLILLLSIVLCLGIAYGGTQPTTEMTGIIQKVVFDDQGNMKEVSVINNDEIKESYDKVIAIITDNTKILKNDLEITELAEGQTINIIFKEGPMLMIYPARIEAEQIKVTASTEAIKEKAEQIDSPDNSSLENTFMDEFTTLINQDTEIMTVLEFVNNNISALSPENASTMLDKFEEFQKANLPKIEEKFYSAEIQTEINNIYQPGFDLNKIDSIDNQKLKTLLIEARDSGYKVETAEGMYFPVIDYELYKNYSSSVTFDIREYIEIMAVESNKVPAKDAALVISWDEILKRALSQEKFINRYPNSMKMYDMKQLFKKYVTFTLYGLNNTPLFNYDSKLIEDDAKNVYTKAVKNHQSSQLIEILQGYLDILAENNYQLTDQIDQYRKDIVSTLEAKYFSPNNTLTAMQNDIDMLKAESHVQQVEESNYGDSTQKTCVLSVTDNELQFDAVPIVFSGDYQGHYTPGKSYPFYADAAMGGQRGITVKDNFGIWHTFGYRVPISE